MCREWENNTWQSRRLALLHRMRPGGEDALAQIYEGIDVSVYQGEIDFTRVRAAGKEVVYIRAGYGTSEDTRFRANAEGARKAGMKLGFYFFVTARSAAQAEEQGRYFAGLIRGLPYTCRPAVDFEEYGELSVEALNEIALAFARTVEVETGHTPAFYTNVSSVESKWREALTRYPLWIAEWGVSEPASLGNWREWAGFQYSNTGRVSGIETDVDLDYFTDAVLLEEEAGPFSDVRAGAWYYDAVVWAQREGVVQGYADGKFYPEKDATRAEVAAMLYRLNALWEKENSH